MTVLGVAGGRALIGVGLGGNGAKIGLVNQGGSIIADTYMPITKAQRNPDFIFSGIASNARTLLSQNDMGLEDMDGLGIGFPGFLFKNGVVANATNLNPLFNGMSIPNELSTRLDGISVFAANDANAYAVGEHRFGAARGYDSAILFTLGTGVGGGVIIDGKLHVGDRGMAAELGHIKVMHGQLVGQCGCGSNGCVEQLCGEKGFMTMIHSELMQAFAARELLSTVDCDELGLTPKHMAELASGGNTAALGAWELYGKYLGWAIADAISCFEIDLIILGGGIARAFNFFGDAVKRSIDSMLVSAVSEGVQVVKGAIDDRQAEIVGAAALVESVGS